MRLSLVCLALVAISCVLAQHPGGGASDDDDDFVYDPEEFEGVQHAEAPAPTPVSEQQQQSNNIPVNTGAPIEATFRPKSWQDYGGEIFAVIVIALYIINYFLGKRKNMRLATSWYRGAMNTFIKNFAWLGRGETSEPHMWKESASLFQFYATGRIHIDSVKVNLDLCGRQDLFSVVYNMFSPQKDVVIMEIAMPDDTIDNIVLAVVSRREEKAVRAERPDIDKLGKRVGVSGLSELLVCLADTPASVDFILAPLVNRLSQHDTFVRSIHISDRISGTSSAPKKGMRVELYLNPKGCASEEARATAIKDLTKLTIAFADRASNFKLSTKDREKTKALRSAMIADEFKSNAKAREEDIARRKAEAIEKMSPEEQRKAMEKNARKEAKKASKMFRVVKMKG